MSGGGGLDRAPDGMRQIALTMLIAGAATSAHGDLADVIVRQARQSVGMRYAYGGTGKTTDCAALTRRVAQSAGVKLPRTSRAQYGVGQPVGRSELAPGDLVFFRNTYRAGISHVGVYIGAGEFVHAASRQRHVVIDRLDEPYFARKFAGGRRIVAQAGNAAGICAVP